MKLDLNSKQVGYLLIALKDEMELLEKKRTDSIDDSWRYTTIYLGIKDLYLSINKKSKKELK